MKINPDGSVEFTRNEVFVIGSGINGFYAADAMKFETSAARLCMELPNKLREAGWNHNKEAGMDLARGGDIGVFTGL